MMRTMIVVLSLFLLSTAAESAFAGHAGRGKVDRSRVEVMTQNQFLGADFGPLGEALSIGDPDLIQMLLEETFGRMADNDFPLRAQALAEQICDKQPAAVGLQEVFRISLDGISGFPLPLPFVDHLEETMAAIDAQCGNYVVKASVKNVDVEQEVDSVMIGFLDRDVILVRADLDAFSEPTDFSHLPLELCRPAESGVVGLDATGCNYFTVVPLPPFGNIERGYVGVDLLIDGQVHRVVNTHLEVQLLDPDMPDSSFFQAAQATELLNALNSGFLVPADNTILVGDFNSSPEHAANPPSFFVPPYTQIGSGTDLFGQPIFPRYTDIWLERPGRRPGYTCCYEEDLSVRRAKHDERIDLIFSLVPPSRVKARVLGRKKSDRIGGLWPSDHCTVNGRLEFWF